VSLGCEQLNIGPSVRTSDNLPASAAVTKIGGEVTDPTVIGKGYVSASARGGRLMIIAALAGLLAAALAGAAPAQAAKKPGKAPVV
jgi:hypothetical protein